MNQGDHPAVPVPPSNLDAEESVIGACLLTANAIDAVAEIVRPADFYRGTHTRIFEVILAMHGAGEPVDAITLVDELERRGILEDIGGRSRINELAALVPATSNVAHYARIVRGVAVSREMIRAGQELSRIGFEREGRDDSEMIESAEQIVFEMAQRRATSQFTSLAQTVGPAYQRVRYLFEQGEAITGVPSGLPVLDEVTSGFQPGNLIVIGARPSIGKSAMALGVCAHIVLRLERPVALFTLEMSRSEVTQRLMSMEGMVESQLLRNGRLEAEHWNRLTNVCEKLAKAPLYIDDSGMVTMMEIRSKARRLKLQQPDLALIVVDYLQLMTSGTSQENRVQEISAISRNLKILAGELEVPVLALSQLSRAPEARHDKRPVLSDLRDSGCLLASARIARADTGEEVTIGSLLLSQDFPSVWALDDHWRLVPTPMTAVFPTGIKPTFQLRLASGRRITATANHPLRTIDGWRCLEELKPGDYVAVPRLLPEPGSLTAGDADEILILAHMLGNGTFGPGIKYSTPDPACRDAIADAVRRRFQVEAQAPQRGKVWEMWFPAPYRLARGRHHPMQPWISEQGLWLHRAQSKFVPDWVFGLPTSQIEMFLHHLWATDGSITISRNRCGRLARIYYSSSSARLAADVSRLLLRLEIATRITPARKAGYATNWHVTVSDRENTLRFLNRVGAFGRRGAAIGEAREIVEALKHNPNVDLVPQPVANRIRALLTEKGVSHRALAEHLGEGYCGSYLLGDERRPRRFSRGRLARIADRLDDAFLRELATSDVLWDEIMEVTDAGEQPTFDVTTAQHNFIADNIIVHNSIEQDADVVMFIYRDEYYNAEDSENQGIAEVNIAKHRNGPTNTVKLSFVKRWAKFSELAPSTTTPTP